MLFLQFSYSLMFLSIQTDLIILKTFNQQFTLTAKKSLHIIFKADFASSIVLLHFCRFSKTFSCICILKLLWLLLLLSTTLLCWFHFHLFTDYLCICVCCSYIVRSELLRRTCADFTRKITSTSCKELHLKVCMSTQRIWVSLTSEMTGKMWSHLYSLDVQ